MSLSYEQQLQRLSPQEFDKWYKINQNNRQTSDSLLKTSQFGLNSAGQMINSLPLGGEEWSTAQQANFWLGVVGLVISVISLCIQ